MPACEHGQTGTHSWTEKVTNYCTGPNGKSKTCEHGRTSGHDYQYSRWVTCSKGNNK